MNLKKEKKKPAPAKPGAPSPRVSRTAVRMSAETDRDFRKLLKYYDSQADVFENGIRCLMESKRRRLRVLSKAA